MKFTAVTPTGYTVTADAQTIDDAAANLESRGFEVIDYADDTTIVIADS